MKVALISPYEIGRQPFALAQPATWLKQDGFEVDCIDLAIEPFEPERIAESEVVAIHLAMHTGARLAARIIPSILNSNPHSEICTYGLYSPVNDEFFRSLGVKYIFGGESESDILTLCRSVRSNGSKAEFQETRNSISKLDFQVPDRSLLPSLTKYSKLTMPDSTDKVVGFVEASRGCKHLCRHCPVVPVYQGKFRVIPRDIVLADVRKQIFAGAEHISFGDPDFLNGPGHARRIVDQLHAEFPEMTWDATIKIEHILKHASLLKEFSQKGCLFITSAVESVEDTVLNKLEKNHTREDFLNALSFLRELDIYMLPTFVPFTPWSTAEGYCRLLSEIADLNLVSSIPPVQLCIRLLIPQGSRLLDLPDSSNWLGEFDALNLGYGWQHPDQQMDVFQQQVQNCVMEAESSNLDRQEVFRKIWKMAYESAGRTAPNLTVSANVKVPQMSEPWYCCAEPTDDQFSKFS